MATRTSRQGQRAAIRAIPIATIPTHATASARVRATTSPTAPLCQERAGTGTCTADNCVAGVCDNPLIVGNCLIGGVCFANGDDNPANDCQQCISASDTGAFTGKGAGDACGDPADTECDNPDTCDGAGACQSNTEPDGAAPPGACGDGLTCTVDNCLAGVCDNPLTVGNCLIGGVCFANGDDNPANDCEECNAAVSTGAWSLSAEGTACERGRGGRRAFDAFCRDARGNIPAPGQFYGDSRLQSLIPAQLQQPADTHGFPFPRVWDCYESLCHGRV